MDIIIREISKRNLEKTSNIGRLKKRISKKLNFLLKFNNVIIISFYLS